MAYFSIEEIVSLTSSFPYKYKFRRNPILAAIYGGCECPEHIRDYITMPNRVRQYLYREIPGLEALDAIASECPALGAVALEDFRKTHGSDFDIRPM